MKYLVVGLCVLLLGVGVGVLAQSPYRADYLDYWKVVQEVRSTFRISPKVGLAQSDIKLLEPFLSTRQLNELWNATSFGPITSLSQLSKVKYMGPSSLVVVLTFFSFADEKEVGPAVLGKVRK